ncbi:S-adenosylmethionine sensor upstream of mTORC1-like [Pecten maximus]|uniref:S-adenosylmethionine sensor upstream of mTORC1-like n=1 Tax=Pecten maximus TaxID=6579 RepID=UPI001458C234|nr:S-adenosylmethionine sensor upstream of mTORC1-like [Pecten maximus]
MFTTCESADATVGSVMATIEGREEHIRLAGIIKGLHADLRKKFKKCTDADDFEQIWKEHCSDTDTLRQYADAMHHLATDHWTRLPETRIDWCRKTILEYFHGGGLKKALEKVSRRIQVHRAKKLQREYSDRRKKDTSKDEQRDQNVGNDSENVDLCISAPSLPEVYDEATCVIDTDTLPTTSVDIGVPFRGRIRLLDVGSCYNPFAGFEEFLSIGLDISPANSKVHRCDFLNLELTDPDPSALSKDDPFGGLPDTVSQLPRQSFHVVVFSLLLEYLPSAGQRWTCCCNAHQLLAGNGLLVVVTPDSHKQHRNAAMIKSWRQAIESLGFVRWRYVKLDHLHCLAFRKIHVGEVRDKELGPASPDMLYIPQDFHEDEDADAEVVSRSDTDIEDISKTFEELPACWDSDEDD